MRFESMSVAPGYTRLNLRRRLAGFLHEEPQKTLRPSAVEVNDLVALALLESIEITHHAERTSAEQYLQSVGTANYHPTMEELLASGWLVESAGRVYFLEGPDVYQGLRFLPRDEHTVLSGLRSHINKATRRFPATSVDPAAEKIIASDDFFPAEIGCPTPAWVAARLWERRGERAAPMQWWIDRWALLGFPSFVPSASWEEATAKTFIDSALALLRLPSSLASWEELFVLVQKRIPLLGRTQDGWLSSVPSTAVERAEWLLDPHLEPFANFAVGDYGAPLSSVASLLFAEADDCEMALGPSELAKDLIALAFDRPRLLSMMIGITRRAPRFIADLALFAPSSAFACWVVASKHVHRGGWDVPTVLPDALAAQQSALEDVVSLMNYHVVQGDCVPQEAAPWWAHLFVRHFKVLVESPASRAPGHWGRLLDTLTAVPSTAISAMISALGRKAEMPHWDPARLAAALELGGAGRLEPDDEHRFLVMDYQGLLQRYERSLLAKLSPRACAYLARVIEHAGAEFGVSLAEPFDRIAWYEKEVAAHDKVRAHEEIAQALRVHLHVICRALLGIVGPRSSRVVDAFEATIRSGVYDQAPQKFAAFEPRREVGLFIGDTPSKLGEDLATAIGILPLGDQKRVIDALVETNEPLILAQVVGRVDQDLQEPIRDRLHQLSPGKTGAVWSQRESDHRIQALLDARETALARRFLEAEPEAGDRMPMEALPSFRTHLRAMYDEQDWKKLDEAQVPVDVPDRQRDAAQEALDFMRAVAEFEKPEGRPEMTVGVFELLARKNPGVSAYRRNARAARITALLKGDLFRQLSGKELEAAMALLRDIEQPAPVNGVPLENGPFDDLQRALLLLAVGQPERALSLLRQIDLKEEADQVRAYSAVAWWRLGRRSTAIQLLQGTDIEGASPVCKGALSHLRGEGTPRSMATLIQGLGELESEEWRMRSVLLGVRDMDALDVARLLHQRRTLQALLIDLVRGACTSITGMVPMMKRSISVGTREDDLSTLLRELLRNRLHFLGWNIADQSLGGYAPKGGPGERDMVIMRSTTHLAVIESLVVRTNGAHTETTQKDAAKHFRKLFGYEDCDVYCHVTFDFVKDDATPLLQYCERMAQEEVPDGYTFLSTQRLRREGSAPGGVVAEFRRDDRRISVVFLVLDMDQSDRVAAAAHQSAALQGAGAPATPASPP